MLTKYTLTNVPDGGIGHLLPGKGLVIVDERLTDELADEMIALGLSHYFTPIELNQDGKVSESTESTGNRNRTGGPSNRKSARTTTALDSQTFVGGASEGEGPGAISETPGGE